jgi:hypothetical protein
VIVGQDHGGRIPGERLFHHLARVDARAVQCADSPNRQLRELLTGGGSWLRESARSHLPALGSVGVRMCGRSHV